jgi:hypothetical protein
MLPITELVEFCDSEYAKGTEKCSHCKKQKCQGACLQCFDEIHFGDNRDYDCLNLMNHYVCTYIYAYSSEIWHSLNAVESLKNLGEYRVLSIGCGPTSELFGVSRIAGDKKIKYVGFELNDLWRGIHRKVTEIVEKEANCSADIRIGDVLEEFSELDIKPNVVVLSYLISHLSKSTINAYNFLLELKTKVFDNLVKPYYIIINDINHWKTRNYFDLLQKRLESDKGNDVSCIAFHFKGISYGRKHEPLQLDIKVPDNINLKYKTRQQSKRTAQLIIRVN